MTSVVLIFVVLVPVAMIGLRATLQHRVERHRVLDGVNRIEELSFWTIGGIPQCVQVRGNADTNPLLVYLHGGPGLPAMPFAHGFQRAWEDHFTVVHWDQRLSGKTLVKNGLGAEPPSLNQFVEDGLDLVRQLRKRFPKSPIVVLAHSWGTAIAVEMLRRDPAPIAAYVAVGQVSDFMLSERYGYRTVLAEAKRRSDSKVLKALAAHPNYPEGADPSPAAIKTIRQAYMKFGFGHHGNKLAMLQMLALAFRSPDYSWRDLLSLFNPKAQDQSLSLAIEALTPFSERNAGARLPCPVFMVGGRHDLFTPTPMARAFFETLQTAQKEFIEVDDLAHFGPVEKPEFFHQFLCTRVLSVLGRPPVS